MERTYSMSGWRQVQRQVKQQNDRQRAYIKSLPLPIRKAIKRCNAAQVAYNLAALNKAEHRVLIELHQAYEAIRNEVDRMIREHNDATTD